jgi:hypothetical protein
MNPPHQCSGVQSAELDGVAIDPDAIPIHDDGGTHDVVVTLGRGDPQRHAARAPAFSAQQT